MKKNNTAEKSILEAEKISKALKEGTQNSLTMIMNEAINRLISESKDEEDEDSFEVEDVETEETPNTDGDACADGSCDCEDGECEDDTNDGADDEWSDMEQYKVGDNDYDFTGVNGDEILKVYNKLGDDDQIFVKKDEEGNYEVKDEETGAEYVIKLDADNEDAETPDFEDDEEGATEYELDMTDDDDSDEIEIDFEGDGGDADDDEEVEFEFGDPEDDDDDEEETLNEENLGYTNNYQKDVMPGLKMNEPADSKTTYSMDAGAPDGNKRPYSGYENKESNLFTKKTKTDLAENEDIVNQDGEEIPNLEEGATSTSSQSVAKTTHTPTSGPRAEHKREVAKLTHAKGGYVSESFVKGLIEKAKEIQCENKKYAEALKSIKVSLNEAAVLNVSLAQIVKLLSENTTNAEEKKTIVERFSNVKTINESKNLYDTIKRELNSTSKNASIMLEQQISVNGSNTLNETTMYQNRQSNPSLNLMDRMENLYK